jgi:hypothetical protein
MTDSYVGCTASKPAGLLCCRSVLVAGLFLWSAATAATALPCLPGLVSTQPAAAAASGAQLALLLLLGVRGLMGLASAAAMPCVTAISAQLVPASDRGSAVSFVYACFNAGEPVLRLKFRVFSDSDGVLKPWTETGSQRCHSYMLAAVQESDGRCETCSHNRHNCSCWQPAALWQCMRCTAPAHAHVTASSAVPLLQQKRLAVDLSGYAHHSGVVADGCCCCCCCCFCWWSGGVLGLALVPPLAMALGLPGAFIATVRADGSCTSALWC